MSTGCYDRNGQPITSKEWVAKYGDKAYCQVERTELYPGCFVSTVWLGLDHQFGAGPPIIFETMVFGGPLADTCNRYGTEAEAIVGHARMVERAKAVQS